MDPRKARQQFRCGCVGHRRIRASDHPPDRDICDTLQTALEKAGAVFIAENGGGIGVRLKLNRSEVRRIGVLENEGGIVGTDAVP